MPTPPFSQDRRDWLDEVFGLIARKRKSSTPTALKFPVPESVVTILVDDGASAKDKAVVDAAGRPR